jgi:hypothetical protein
VQGLSKSWGGARLVALSTWSAPSAVGPFIPLKYSELLDGGVGRVQELNVVAGRAYAEVKVPDKVVAFDLSSRSTIGETALRAEAPVAGTDGAFAITLGPYGLAHIDLSGRVNQVLTVPSPRVVVYPVVDHSPPTSLVWLEATLAGGEPTEGALWASPYATDGAALKPRKLITLAPPLPRVVANAGLVLWRESNTTARVLRVSDGSTWTMTGETGRAFTGALWVTADEAWLATADASLPSPGSYTSGVMRLRRELWTSP